MNSKKKKRTSNAHLHHLPWLNTHIPTIHTIAIHTIPAMPFCAWDESGVSSCWWCAPSQNHRHRRCLEALDLVENGCSYYWSFNKYFFKKNNKFTGITFELDGGSGLDGRDQLVYPSSPTFEQCIRLSHNKKDSPGLLALCHPFFTPCRADHNGVPNQGLKCAWHVHSLQALLKLVAQFQVFQAAGPCDSFQALVEPLAKLQIFKAVGKDHLVQAAVEATTKRQTLKAAWKGHPFQVPVELFTKSQALKTGWQGHLLKALVEHIAKS